MLHSRNAEASRNIIINREACLFSQSKARLKMYESLKAYKTVYLETRASQRSIFAFCLFSGSPFLKVKTNIIESTNMKQIYEVIDALRSKIGN